MVIVALAKGQSAAASVCPSGKYVVNDAAAAYPSKVILHK